MKKLFVFLLFLLSSTGLWFFFYITGQDELEINPHFERAVMQSMGYTSGAFRPELTHGVRELDLKDLQLESIEGIQYFKDLEVLDLKDNLITDAALLGELPKLRWLDLSGNNIEKVSLNTERLTYFNAEGNNLTHIEFLEGIPRVNEIDISDNEISDLQSIRNMDYLTALDASRNHIKNLEPLSNLKNLIRLDLRENQITDLSPLAGSVPLSDQLLLDGNQIVNFSGLSEKLSVIVEKDVVVKPSIHFSNESGFIDEGEAVTITSSDPELKIYYTLDGSKPTPQSLAYNEPIIMSRQLDEGAQVLANIKTSPLRDPFDFRKDEVKVAHVIRAAAYRNGQLEIEDTSTYFLSNEIFTRSKLPVISIVASNRDLFSDDYGIYVPGTMHDPENPGTGNYEIRGSDGDRKAVMTYFDGYGQEMFTETVNMRIHGGYTRQLPQKSIRLYADGGEGNTRFYYPFFGDEGSGSYDRLLLRNGGNDWRSTLLRDAMMHRLVEDRGIANQLDQPAIVIVNGEYWGIHQIRETFSADYIEQYYNVKASEVALLEANPDTETGFTVEEGDISALNEYLKFVYAVTQRNIQAPSTVDFVEEHIDLDQFLEYAAYQIYFANQDSFMNNTAIWKKNEYYSRESDSHHDGRWRWMLFDTDRGFGLVEREEGVNQNTIQWLLRDHRSTTLFRTLIQNEEIKERFVVILSDLLNQNFESENVIEVITEMENEIKGEVPASIYRWKNIGSVALWEQNVEELNVFARERPGIVRDQVNEILGLEGYEDITVDLSDPELSLIKINSLLISPNEKSWSGVYYKGSTLTIQKQFKDGETITEQIIVGE
ncbi:CotH kinase family protein [Jeotgalibacillus sp. R-1-5s-1]|uniref:CotH kinase family protein n=1 Tax=Jeotgalibacillus sp. R-1-5s-1 TaxID=2555897 RepID=UPI00106CD962|nr:CotH kinase family protein [Jeotgalibacillus sp. R-1-5s-1]TFD97093.1 hypothetical protein E2491_10415 [Jeotgalibacillus sp. R-1-5s-1]